RGNIKYLIKLSQGFGKTTKGDIRNRVLAQQGNIARIEPLSFVEVGFAPLPLASPPCDIGQRLRNLAAIRQELTCLLKVMHRGVVIFQAGVVVVSLGQHGLAEIGLESERGFSCLSGLFAEGNSWLKTQCEVAERIDVGQQR